MKKAVLLGFAVLLACHSAWADEEVLIRRAIDGETIEISDGRRIHLIGVNATHVRGVLENRFKLPPGRISTLPLATLSTEAAAYIENHAVGKSIILSFDAANERFKHQDPEGRTLAYVWYSSHSSGGEDSEGSEKIFGIKSQQKLLNQELIMMGKVLVDTEHPFVQQEAFLETEKSAAQSKIGFWRSAADLYKELLSQAKGSQSASAAGFISKEARKTSLESAWKSFQKLIELNPKDYLPYYERSWLGASPEHDKISAGNLSDIDQAIALSSFNPKLYMQRAFLLMLQGNYEEAGKSFEKMTHIAGKLGMPALVSEMSAEKLQTAEWKDMAKAKDMEILMMNALRAGLNEERFLFFMAQYKSYGKKVPADFEKVYGPFSTQGRFQLFYKKHEDFLSRASEHDILYKTQWAQLGHDQPEEVMRRMELVGESQVWVSSGEDDKNVIDVTGGEQPPAKKKRADEAVQSETQFI